MPFVQHFMRAFRAVPNFSIKAALFKISGLLCCTSEKKYGIHQYCTHYYAYGPIFKEIFMSASAASSLAVRLGPSPLPRGLAFWIAGPAFCTAAWYIHIYNHVFGSILLGLSAFVNFFCFVQGLNAVRRAAARWLTIRKTIKLQLCPDTVYYQAGFIAADTARGILVCNGRAADYRSISKIICKSTWQAQKLELYGCGRLPLILGFSDRDTLFAAGKRLCADICLITGSTPEYTIQDMLAVRADEPPRSN